jgi:(p)ppGpp synthase/HD superfamily hydrolase
MTRTVDDACALAVAAHLGQVDKAGNPYIDHPAAVAAALEPYGELAVMAGWLHDVVEDSEMTLAELRVLGFPPEVVSAVDSVTRRPGESYDDLIVRAAADPIGRLVKLSDNKHNSDESRLALLAPEQAEWLRTKYARARATLERR